MTSNVCPQCKTVISSQDLYCRKCGVQLNPLPPEKTAATPPPLGLRCPDCGTGIREEDDFCPHCGTNLSEPLEPGGVINETESGQLKRGFWLTAMLILWMVSNAGLALYYLYGSIASAMNGSSATLPLSLWMLFRTCANLVFLAALWKWKKWGVYGIVALLILGDVISIPSLASVANIIGVIVGTLVLLLILYFLLRRVWQQMK